MHTEYEECCPRKGQAMEGISPWTEPGKTKPKFPSAWDELFANLANIPGTK